MVSMCVVRHGHCVRGQHCVNGLRSRHYYILSGSVLSVWTNVERAVASRMQIIRLRTDDGKKIVGQFVLCFTVCHTLDFILRHTVTSSTICKLSHCNRCFVIAFVTLFICLLMCTHSLYHSADFLLFLLLFRRIFMQHLAVQVFTYLTKSVFLDHSRYDSYFIIQLWQLVSVKRLSSAKLVIVLML